MCTFKSQLWQRHTEEKDEPALKQFDSMNPAKQQAKISGKNLCVGVKSCNGAEVAVAFKSKTQIRFLVPILVEKKNTSLLVFNYIFTLQFAADATLALSMRQLSALYIPYRVSEKWQLRNFRITTSFHIQRWQGTLQGRPCFVYSYRIHYRCIYIEFGILFRIHGYWVVSDITYNLSQLKFAF